MKPSDDSWATACAHILTTPTAHAADVEACRAVMFNRRDSDTEVSWPLAFALVGIAAAAAWGLPRLVRALWN